MLETQEPKYDALLFIDGPGQPEVHVEGNCRLVNRETGEPIPDDEPVFVLRAKDSLAMDTIASYLAKAGEAKCSVEHMEVVRKRLYDFSAFQVDHADRMKLPD